MVPYKDAGQPIIIGGVEITHVDQKVRMNDSFNSIQFNQGDSCCASSSYAYLSNSIHFHTNLIMQTLRYTTLHYTALHYTTLHYTTTQQKWTDAEGKYVEKGGIYETQLGVIAHSDGDVIYHSIVDAIFGALTLPDIGQVFQDTDPRWRGCDSSKFMEHAYGVMDGYGYEIGNIDVTLILERPKVAGFKPAMKENIVRLLGTTPGRVNIKARTHEKMDSVGELRSLSCHVVMTLAKK